jgi:hypothetical protein
MVWHTERAAFLLISCFEFHRSSKSSKQGPTEHESSCSLDRPSVPLRIPPSRAMATTSISSPECLDAPVGAVTFYIYTSLHFLCGSFFMRPSSPTHARRHLPTQRNRVYRVCVVSKLPSKNPCPILRSIIIKKKKKTRRW